MPTILFERTRHRVEAPAGGRVLDICDDQPRAGIPFACRGANCGTCRVEVLEGQEHCEPADDDELQLLEHLKCGPEMRLGCQMRVAPGPGLVRLRVTL